MTPQELYDRMVEEHEIHRKLYHDDDAANFQHHAGAVNAYANMLALLVQCEGVIAE
jgi:hypothetical protein